LTPPRQRGKTQYSDEAKLRAAVDRICKHYQVADFFEVSYSQEMKERSIRAHKDKPARVERTVRCQLSLKPKQTAIDQANFRAGWRIYATNTTQERLPLAAAVITYRDQYIEENIFRRLKGKFLSITPSISKKIAMPKVSFTYSLWLRVSLHSAIIVPNKHSPSKEKN
jgi:transposase